MKKNNTATIGPGTAGVVQRVVNQFDSSKKPMSLKILKSIKAKGCAINEY